MEILLAILLYLQVIVSPGTYMQSHIDQMEIQHHVMINQVKADPAQMHIVETEYLPQTQSIIVINDHIRD